jgi:hypothetical protein
MISQVFSWFTISAYMHYVSSWVLKRQRVGPLVSQLPIAANSGTAGRFSQGFAAKPTP